MSRGGRRRQGQVSAPIPKVTYSPNMRKKEEFREFIAALFVKQEGKCRICQSCIGFDFHIDHDHVSGYVRGLLCRDCNLGLGHFHDDMVALGRAAQYLRSAGRRDKISSEELWTPLLNSLDEEQRREAPITALSGRRPPPSENPEKTPSEFILQRWQDHADFVALQNPPFSYLGC
jgi:recombination endonuclease VII